MNIPAIIVIQERNDTLEIAFSDPDMHRPSASDISSLSADAIKAVGNVSTIKIELNGEYEMISSDENVLVLKTVPGKTTIEYREAKAGETYRILLKLPATSVTEKEDSTGIGFRLYNRNNHVYRIESDSGSVFNYTISNLTGSLLFSKKNVMFADDISLQDLPGGIYFLNLHSEAGKKCMRLLR